MNNQWCSMMMNSFVTEQPHHSVKVIMVNVTKSYDKYV